VASALSHRWNSSRSLRARLCQALVSYWVIDTVGRELGTWLRNQDDVRLGINVPPEVFGRGGLEYAASKADLLGLSSPINSFWRLQNGACPTSSASPSSLGGPVVGYPGCVSSIHRISLQRSNQARWLARHH
jgi:hypothetical protein